VGDPHGPYPTPYSAIYRAMAIFGTQGLAVLPQHCAALMALFFTAALLVNLARDLLPHRLARQDTQGLAGWGAGKQPGRQAGRQAGLASCS
ncbi:metal-nicotianamine transporter YSL2, partial [Haematococcus lacustris]